MDVPREYSDHAPVSYVGVSARASGSAFWNSSVPSRVLAQPRVVVEPDERLDEAVEHPQVRVERVDRVVVTVLGRHADAGRRALAEDRQGALGHRQHVGLAVQPGRAAGERLHGGALRQTADPRRGAAAEAEVVLPGHAAAARGGQRQQLVEHEGEPGVALGAPEAVELAEVAEHLELQALAGIELPDQLGALELDPLARADRGAGAPELEVALQREPEGGDPRGGQLPARGDAVERAQDALHLGPPQAVELLGLALGVEVRGAAGRVVRGRDRAGVADALELARGSPLALARGGRLRGPARRRLHRGGGQGAVVTGPELSVAPEDEHVVRGRRGGGEQAAQDGNEQATRNTHDTHDPDARLEVAARLVLQS